MQHYTSVFATAMLTGLFLAGCTPDPETQPAEAADRQTSELSADAYTYQCDDGSVLRAEYDEPNDQMHVEADGKVYTMSPVISGSGAKFMSEENVMYWSHGEDALFNPAGDDEASADFLRQCTGISAQAG
jgi:membrane-bound inhibitor of C-type lysozyme